MSTLTTNLLTALVLAFSAVHTAYALEQESLLELNSIEQQEQTIFSTKGADPFLVFRLDASESVKQGQAKPTHISIGLSLVKPKLDELALEVFFQPMEARRSSSEHTLFEPLHRLKLKVPKAALEAGSGRLLIAIPEGVDLNVNQEIRIDIDRCTSCVFNVDAAPKLVSHANTATPKANQVFAYRVFNGAKPISTTGTNIATQDWHLNDIKRLDNWLKFDGGDPFLVSQDLDTNTDELGGVLFTFKYQNNSEESRNYQLFYATDRHAFVETASSAVRVKDDEPGVSRFVIPLDFLSESIPRAAILERLRIDLIPANDDIGSWQITETTVLNKAQLAEYSGLVPARIVHNKRQRARGLVLLKNVVIKIFDDPWFVIFYLLLVTLTATVFWRQFKR